MFAHLPLEFDPGERFGYSGFGYYLLGVILERASGQSLGELLRTRIFEPAGMRNTSLEDGLPIPRRARAYQYDFERLTYRMADYRDATTTFSTGGVYSTAHDLWAFHRALRDGALLHPASQELMLTPVADNYGYGWMVEDATFQAAGSTRLVRHNGAVTGYTASFMRFPAEDRCVIVMSNTRGYKSTTLPWLIADLMYGDEAQAWPPLDKILYETVVRQGTGAALAQYRNLEATQPGDYPFEQEPALILLGHLLLRFDRAEAATSMLHLNLERFPDWWRSHNMLGRAYRQLGKIEKAAAAYDRSLELNPENRPARQALEEIRAGSDSD